MNWLDFTNSIPVPEIRAKIHKYILVDNGDAVIGLRPKIEKKTYINIFSKIESSPKVEEKVKNPSPQKNDPKPGNLSETSSSSGTQSEGSFDEEFDWKRESISSEISHVPSNFADRNGQFDTDWDASDSEDLWDSFEDYWACYEEYAIEKLSDDYVPIPDCPEGYVHTKHCSYENDREHPYLVKLAYSQS